MEITFLGHSSFKLKGKSATLITDPFNPKMTGFSFPKTSADIVTVSHDHEDHNQSQLVEGNPFVIFGPGEYEIKDVLLFGLPTFHGKEDEKEAEKNTIYLIEMDGLKLLHLGDLGHKLKLDQLEGVEEVDILFIPVGNGKVTLGPSEAVEVIANLEPKIVIPMHYQTEDLNKENFGQLVDVKDFLKQLGVETTPQPKLTITRDSLPEEMQVVVLERK